MVKEQHIFNTEEEVVLCLCKLIEEIANLSIQQRQNFRIGLSGGSLVKFLNKGLRNINTNWDKWIFFFCDERLVPFDDSESTYGLYKKQLLQQIPIKESQFVTINEKLSAEDAAADYTTKIKKYFPNCEFPDFDLLLLGMGPDGHTASLFPDHPLLEEKTAWVSAITDSPKPPPSRITLTLPVINTARNCIFAVCGKEKSSVIKKILNDSVKLPASLVQPVNGKVYWLLDKAAASEL